MKVRVIIQFEFLELALLKEEARKAGISFAELIRRRCRIPSERNPRLRKENLDALAIADPVRPRDFVPRTFCILVSGSTK
jgi:hypothetical protein